MIIDSKTKHKITNERGVNNEKDDEKDMGISISMYNDRDDVTRFDDERKSSNFLFYMDWQYRGYE